MVEQWPFKPFVTGSNPVRPRSYFFLLVFLSIIFSDAHPADSKLIRIKSDDNHILHGNLYEHAEKKSVFLIVHGTRAFNEMEIIKKISQSIHDEGYDVLSINLSYGVSARNSNFLSCDIEHRHNEHSSVGEIIKWYEYLLSLKYHEINFLGHSRGAFNITQAASLIENKLIKLYLLAPVIDTYAGTSEYYRTIHNLPYDDVINSDEEFMISDRYPPINFLFCENAKVSASTFRSYLDFSRTKHKYPFTFDILELLEDIDSQVIIFSGTEDEILLDNYKILTNIDKPNISHHIIEGGDHFFRDIYLDDVIDIIFE